MPSLKITKFAFLILGIVSLAPWNTVISNQSYYETKCDQLNFSFFFILPNIIASILISLLFFYKSSQIFTKLKLYIPLFLGSIFMLITPATAYILGTVYGYLFFIFVVFVGALLSAVIQLAAIGYAVKKGNNLFLNHFIIGTGFSGVITSVLRIFDLLVFNQGLNVEIVQSDKLKNTKFFSQLVQYIINILFFQMAVILCNKCFGSEEKLEIQDETNNSNEENLMNNNNSHTIVDNNDDTNNNNTNNNINNNKNQLEQPIGTRYLLQIFKKSLRHQLLMLLITFETFFLFPDISLKKKVSILNEEWKVAFLLLIFNFGDTFGKWLNLYLSRASNCRITSFCIFRFTILFPFIMMYINAHFLLFGFDWFVFVIMFFLGLTNGVWFTQILLSSTRLYETKKEIEISQYLFFFIFTIGTAMGAILQYAVIKS